MFTRIATVLLVLLFASPAFAATQYINAVVPISITIASGATTGTQSAGVATGTYFMMWGGSETTATTSSAQAFCHLTWNDATGVVTATRQTSSTNTTTCQGTLVDATSNLVTSVQHGVIAISSGVSNTASLGTTVTTTDSSIHLLGYIKSNTTFSYAVNTPILSLTSTVVTATINALTTGMSASWEVVNWNHAALAGSTQYFNKSWTNSTTTTTQAISPTVDPNNSLLIWAGDYNNNCCSFAVDQQWGQITSSSVVTITTFADGDGVHYAATVVPFVSGVFTQNVQRGSNTIPAAALTANNTVTSAAMTATSLHMTGWTTTTSTTTSMATIMPTCAQANSTTITCTTGANVPTSKTTTSGWELATWSAASVTPAVQCVPTGANKAGLIYPIYTDPPSAIYSGLITLMGTYPNVPVIAILNPNNGPGASASAAYTTAIGQLQTAGAIILGYIETGYGVANKDYTPQNETTMEADIATWQSFYPAIQGIFIDEMDDTGSTTGCTSISGGNCIALYQALTTYAHGLGLYLTYGNPGENTISAYFSSSPPAVDRYMVYETNAYGTAANYNNAGLCNYINCAVVAYTVSYSSSNLTTMMQNAAWVFMTDDHATNPYDAAPTYLSTEMAAISAFNSAGTGTSCATIQGFP